MTDPKTHLHHYLTNARAAVLWKLEGLGEYDIRRPLTPTGTNLLGLVKHLTCTTADYFGTVFDRPFPDPQPWFDPDTAPGADMWATPDEPTGLLIDLYHRTGAHADAVITELDLDTEGRVPWWPAEDATVTLHRILVHMIDETNRHAGHADIIRELIDGSAGLRQGADNLPANTPEQWTAHYNAIEQAARAAAAR
ncbi:DinB family protein [Glycomyces tritici]|uniref:DinB family protein n=1 Tax=Glycomyces tritici TaxID=2665176 RepID=A0ABT7YVY7_9ACTN|nr:DinB family protein [Glycomyces tritici]MDN3242810.1 DinB family protein [Glycomyces tritici]